MPSRCIAFCPAANRLLAIVIAFLIAFGTATFNTTTLVSAEENNAKQTQLSSLADSVMPAIRKHCVKCHGENGEIEGNVDLKHLDAETLHRSPDLLGSLIDVLDLEEMPPEDEPALDPKIRQQLVAHLKASLRANVSESLVYSHAPLRRMNRFQYNNAVIDLFGLNCIVFTLPERMLREHKGYFQPKSGKMPDAVRVGSRPLGKSQLIEPRLAGVAAFPQDLRAEHGFDNQGDHLSLSPLLMEAFLKLGQSITQSPDFTNKYVGIWKSFFEVPTGKEIARSDVRNRLQPFLTRAFRGPVSQNQLDRYTDFVMSQIESGVDFTKAMKAIAAATIASPKFLYLYDKAGQDETAESIDDFELASRLSFFLWGGLPDDELLQLADSGQLHTPDVLDIQIDRLLHDRKLKRFCDSFPTQWLQLDRIISSTPNREIFKDFYLVGKFRDSMHMMLEPLLLFETVLIEDLPITQLIDPDFSYRSSVLQEAYGELASSDAVKKRGGVAVLQFERIGLKYRRTGGVITNTAVMTMTSGPDRTQPITRGAWIAGVVFNNPPEPPPADVPALDEKPSEAEAHLTLRERLSLHRERSDCKGCHEQIDPLGFALENYTPVGKWRNQYENGRDVDSAGTLFRKHKFNDVTQFKDAIVAEKDRFTRALAGHLLSFALGRQLAAADQIALDAITKATIQDDYKMKSLIKHVILSDPFMSKSNPKAIVQK